MKSFLFLNPVTNLLLFVIKMFCGFIARQYLVFYIGIEILGVNGVIVETIAMLSLLEMGLQATIIYRLYAPIAKGDIENIYRIYSVLVKAYRSIGALVLIGGLLVSPFVYDLANTPLQLDTVYTIYFIQLSCSVCNYFIMCPRILLLAHQKQYVNNIIDSVIFLCLFGLQLIFIIKFRNYYLYLACNAMQIFISNAIITRYAKQSYLKNFKNNSIDRKIYKTIRGDLKHILVGKLSSFIYSSTDNILISLFCGSIVVGYISNYKMVTTALRSLCESYHVSLMPSFGNYFARDSSKERVHTAIEIYNFFQFVITCLLLVPLYCLLPDFIRLWLGDAYVLPQIILVLLVLDCYINNMEQPCTMALGCLGCFKEDKIVSLFAALANIVFSVFFAFFLQEEGVLLGTIIAISVFWVGRSIYAFIRVDQCLDKKFARYWVKNFEMFSMFVCLMVVFSYFLNCFSISNNVGTMLCKVVIMELMLLAILWGVFHKTFAYKTVVKIYIFPFLKEVKDKIKATN